MCDASWRDGFQPQVAAFGASVGIRSEADVGRSGEDMLDGREADEVLVRRAECVGLEARKPIYAGGAGVGTSIKSGLRSRVPSGGRRG